MKCERCGTNIEHEGPLCAGCAFNTDLGVRWFIASEECLYCGQEDETLFPGGPISLECSNCRRMVPIPFERREITEVEARQICVDKGITLEDLLHG